MKKFTSILLCSFLILTLSGCSKNGEGLNFWQGLLLGGLCLIYAGAFIAGIAGCNDFSIGLLVLGYIMAGLACGITLVLYGIIYSIWWMIIVAVVLFVAYVIIMKIVEYNS